MVSENHGKGNHGLDNFGEGCGKKMWRKKMQKWNDEMNEKKKDVKKKGG